MAISHGPFTVQRILSNNAVLVKTVKGNDVILLGKGLGFGRKERDLLTNPKYEKIFVVPEGGEEQALDLIERVDPAVMQVTEEIIKLVKLHLGEVLHSRVYLGLADHINFTLIRLSQGMEIKNPFISEIKAMYPTEFSIAEQGANLIAERLKVTIPHEEIGFIALHLHSARHNRPVGESLKHSEIINQVVKYLETKVGPLKERGGLNYTRLLSHLQSCINRLITKMTIENPIIEQLKEKFAESYQMARHVGDIMGTGLGIEVPDAEIGYLTIHLERLRCRTD
ncbi:PRD domain-containing protein [Sporomusa sp.]|uniref:PRD domain-containing protein n=1 Tax=Sporomusa sp. TaxID=2078658 RepID=UPI002CBE7898|nr:PRD domain-containing protein [Sporomusa sp.]HWR43717.1 PRD domain-containing protein [Sporomusa sp.]